MGKQIFVSPFPVGAESDGFFAALSSVVLKSLGYASDTPYWCSPNENYCRNCGNCHEDKLIKHHESIYHALLTASGTAFAFDYPEDDDVGYHTMPDIPIGWRWAEPFVSSIMDFAGLAYKRYKNKTVAEIQELISENIDNGLPAIISDYGIRTEQNEWLSAWPRSWSVVCGYSDDGLIIMNYGGETTEVKTGIYNDIITVTGKTSRKKSYLEILEKIYAVLTHPTHDALEKEIYNDLSTVTCENAENLAYKLMGINGMIIEARWHAAEAFCSSDNLLSSLTDDINLKSDLKNIFFNRFIKNDNNETHGVGWKIWGCLNVSHQTGYNPTKESFVLIQKPEIQNELKNLFKFVFDNDRAVAEGIKTAIVKKTENQFKKFTLEID